MGAPENRRLHLILCWHMHQPDYRDYASGEFQMPWAYLHAIKDYADMAAHVEAEPRARAVFNFVPVLLDQLEDYVAQFDSETFRDPLLRALATPDLNALSDADRKHLIDACFRCDHEQMIQPYVPYKRLFELFKSVDALGEGALSYLSGQYLADLVTWYHLVWVGETVRRSDPLPVRLMAKGSGFEYPDRQALLALLGDTVRRIIPRYRELLAQGRIEISCTPHFHPIAPLLIDFQAAREAAPDAALPHCNHYPGGSVRARYHINLALESHTRRFGAAPAGMWPAEGGVSQPLLGLFKDAGLSWTATGTAVLANSLWQAGQKSDRLADYLYRPYQLKDQKGGPAIFFRDDGLSDMIGFEYAKWNGQDAANHFVQQLENIYHAVPEGPEPVVSVILDGENAWEYYPYNGYFFLSALYKTLAEHPCIHMTTFRDYLREHAAKAKPTPLSRLAAGSWVYGNFSTWIGDRSKNAAWDLLCEAKRAHDLVLASGGIGEERLQDVERQLCDCESSDWFWWFGDYNPQSSVESFDRLYRENLMRLYRLLGIQPPASLGTPICHGSTSAVEAGGAMRRAS